jgi:hypothetical protein
MSAKKLTAILIIVFALIILIGLIYFMFLAPVKETPTPAAEQATTTAKTLAPEVKAITPPKVIRQEQTSEEDLKRLAASFVERYGSYSNQSGYENIRDLEIFMSSAMKTWANSYLEQTRNQNAATDIYYGIITKAVVVETKNFDESAYQAEFLVKAQRKESIGVGANARTFQQDAQVSMVKEGGVWKVSKVKWEE